MADYYQALNGNYYTGQGTGTSGLSGLTQVNAQGGSLQKPPVTPGTPPNQPPGGAIAPAGPSPQAQPIIPPASYSAPTTTMSVASAGIAQEDLARKRSFLENTTNSVNQQGALNAANAAATALRQQQEQQAQQEATDKANELAIKQQEADTRAKAMSGASGATPTPENTTGTASPAIAGTTSGATDSYEAELAANNQRTEDAYAEMHAATQQIMNGTFPLNQYEQALVDGLHNSIDQARTAQGLANKNYEGGITQAGIVSGISRYSPALAQGRIFKAVSDGVTKIQNIDQQGAQALAQLHQGFADNHYKAIIDNYNKLNDLLKEKTATIKSVHDAATAAAKDLRDYNLQVNQDNITNTLNSDKFDYQQKQDAITNAFSEQRITEQQASDLRDAAYKNADLAIRNADLALKKGEYDATYGVFKNVTNINNSNQNTNDNTNTNINNNQMTVADLPGVREAQPGVLYFDPTQFSDAKQRAAAENVARQMGVPIISDKDAPLIEQGGTTIDRINDAEALFSKIAAPNVLGSGLLGAGKTALANASHSLGYNNQFEVDKIAYNNARQSIITLAGQLTGGGSSRALGYILQGLQDALPVAGSVEYTGFVTPENIASATAKFNSARKLVYSGLGNMIDKANLPASGAKIYGDVQSYAQDHPTITLSNGTQVSTLDQASRMAQEHPNWPASYILKLLNQ